MHGLTLDSELSYQDLGVSAYHGRNAEDGQLGEFLRAVHSGLVPRGSFLLVESLDRISRQAARRAMAILGFICDEGITVVTLSDNREYTKASLDADPTSLIMSLLIFIRANEESATKARRIRESWVGKRIKAANEGKKLTAKCPAWLELDKATGTFTVREDRAGIVRQIFEETLAGKGQHAIAQGLNERGTPTWGNGSKRGPAKHWHRSYISKILQSPAVMGTFVPHTLEREDRGPGKRSRAIRRPQEPLHGYFPEVITPEEFARVQAMRAVWNGAVDGEGTKRCRAPGDVVRNLFGGLVRCECGKTATRVDKGPKAGHPYLECTGRRAGAGCAANGKPVRYDVLEAAFLAYADQVLIPPEAPEPGGFTVDQELASLDAAVEALNEALGNLVEAVERGEKSGTLTRRIRQLESERAELEAKRGQLMARWEASALPLVDERVRELKGALDAEPFERGRVNSLLKQVFSAIQLDGGNGQVWFVWKNGGKSALTIGMPAER